MSQDHWGHFCSQKQGINSSGSGLLDGPNQAALGYSGQDGMYSWDDGEGGGGGGQPPSQWSCSSVDAFLSCPLLALAIPHPLPHPFQIDLDEQKDCWMSLWWPQIREGMAVMVAKPR